MTATPERAAAAAAAQALAQPVAAARVFCGFDGFVDEMISVVGERTGAGSFAAMGSMRDLGGILTQAAGRNTLREIVVRSQDAGGCAVNLGDALAALGTAVDLWATLGAPQHPAFAPITARLAQVTTLGTVYGRTLAFEFGDGKAMFSAVEQLRELTPELLARADAQGALSRAMAQARLIALTNWTLYPHMTACWRHLQRTVLAAAQRPWLLVDLVDPSGRAPGDITAMLEALAGFQSTCRTVLGVNLTELGVLSRVLGWSAPVADGPGLAARAAELRRHLGIEQVVVHHARLTAVAGPEGAIDQVSAPLCTQPRKTTGAGDRFNAGYALGLLRELPPRERLAVGAASGGFFVRHGRSGTATDLAGFLAAWADGSLARAGAALS